VNSCSCDFSKLPRYAAPVQLLLRVIDYSFFRNSSWPMRRYDEVHSSRRPNDHTHQMHCSWHRTRAGRLPDTRHGTGYAKRCRLSVHWTGLDTWRRAVLRGEYHVDSDNTPARATGCHPYAYAVLLERRRS
jgi:hypothetical protein